MSLFLEKVVLDWFEWHAGELHLPPPPRPDEARHRAHSEATESVRHLIHLLSRAEPAGPELALQIAKLCDLMTGEYVRRR